MRLLLTLTLFVSVSYSTFGYSMCTQIPEDAKNPAVTACDDPTTYTFSIVGTSYKYDKAAYQEGLRQLIFGWLIERGFSPDEVQVEYWLSVPEADPAATQARLVVSAGKAQFIVFLSIHPQDWEPRNLSVSILGKGDVYPSSFGYDAGSLLVKHAENASAEAIQDYLTTYDATQIEPVSGRWFRYHVPEFYETSIRESILNDAEAGTYIEKLELNHVMEWIAVRERVFAFSLSKP